MVLRLVRRVLEFGRFYGIFLLCALFLALVVRDSFIVYCHCALSCDSDRAAWVHPTGHVILVSLLTAIEALVFFAIVRPRSYHRSWGRAILALALFVSWTLLLSALVLFIPWTRFFLLPDLPSQDFFMEHLLWLFLIVCVCGVILVVKLGQLAFDRLRRLSAGRVSP